MQKVMSGQQMKKESKEMSFQPIARDKDGKWDDGEINVWSTVGKRVNLSADLSSVDEEGVSKLADILGEVLLYQMTKQMIVWHLKKNISEKREMKGLWSVYKEGGLP